MAADAERYVISSYFAGQALRELPEVRADFGGAEPPGGLNRTYDAEVHLRADGKAATLLIEVEKALYPRDVREVLRRIPNIAREWPQTTESRQPVCAARAAPRKWPSTCCT